MKRLIAVIIFAIPAYSGAEPLALEGAPFWKCEKAIRWLVSSGMSCVRETSDSVKARYEEWAVERHDQIQASLSKATNNEIDGFRKEWDAWYSWALDRDTRKQYEGCEKNRLADQCLGSISNKLVHPTADAPAD